MSSAIFQVYAPPQAGIHKGLFDGTMVIMALSFAGSAEGRETRLRMSVNKQARAAAFDIGAYRANVRFESKLSIN